MTFIKRKGEPNRKEIPNNFFSIEARRIGKKLTAVISHVVSVVDFTDTSTTLSTHGGKITIAGVDLSISVYENQIVEISGRVESISFE